MFCVTIHRTQAQLTVEAQIGTLLVVGHRKGQSSTQPSNMPSSSFRAFRLEPVRELLKCAVHLRDEEAVAR